MSPISRQRTHLHNIFHLLPRDSVKRVRLNWINFPSFRFHPIYRCVDLIRSLIILIATVLPPPLLQLHRFWVLIVIPRWLDKEVSNVNNIIGTIIPPELIPENRGAASPLFFKSTYSQSVLPSDTSIPVLNGYLLVATHLRSSDPATASLYLPLPGGELEQYLLHLDWM